MKRKLKVLIACEESHNEREEWRDIDGYEGMYQVSNYGNVRSVDRTIVRSNGTKQRRKGKLLKQGNKNGYRFVNLCNGHSVSVHVIVAQAFIGKRPNNMDVCHINGNRSDNRASNLDMEQEVKIILTDTR